MISTTALWLLTWLRNAVGFLLLVQLHKPVLNGYTSVVKFGGKHVIRSCVSKQSVGYICKLSLKTGYLLFDFFAARRALLSGGSLSFALKI